MKEIRYIRRYIGIKKKGSFCFSLETTIHLVHSRSNTPVVSDVKYKRVVRTEGVGDVLYVKARYKMLKVVRRESVHGKKSDYNERF